MDEGQRTRVLLIEDHPIVSAGIRAVAVPEPDLCIVGEATSADRGLRLAGELTPDVVVLPILMEGESRGLELGTQLKLLPDPPKVLIYSCHNSPAETASSFLSGADSFVHRAANPARLLDAIRATARGRRVWLVDAKTPELSNSLQEYRTAFQLTQREQEVLGLVLQHRTNAQIASMLFIELSTVKSHVRKVLGKLGVHGRQELFEDSWNRADLRYRDADYRRTAGPASSGKWHATG